VQVPPVRPEGEEQIVQFCATCQSTPSTAASSPAARSGQGGQWTRQALCGGAGSASGIGVAAASSRRARPSSVAGDKVMKGKDMRSGKEYVESLRDGRVVIIDGDVVDDVTGHPAFTGITSTIGQMYDFAADPANGMTYLAPETGREALKPFMLPRTAEHLHARCEAITK
jgi:hypothetical protein